MSLKRSLPVGACIFVVGLTAGCANSPARIMMMNAEQVKEVPDENLCATNEIFSEKQTIEDEVSRRSLDCGVILADLRQRQQKQLASSDSDPGVLPLISSQANGVQLANGNTIIDEFYYGEEDAILKYSEWQDVSLRVGDLEVDGDALILRYSGAPTARQSDQSGKFRGWSNWMAQTNTLAERMILWSVICVLPLDAIEHVKKYKETAVPIKAKLARFADQRIVLECQPSVTS